MDTKGSGKGIRARKQNQDSYGVETLEDTLYCGVFDGHGAHGTRVSQMVRDCVPGMITDCLRNQRERSDVISVEDRRKGMLRAFSKAFCEGERVLRGEASGVDHRYSGTTGTCVWLDHSELYCAWAGDSRAIMGRADRVVDLTWDQKPTREDEKKRVRAAGARVTRWKKEVGPQRVWLPDEWLPGLAMTRSIGDTVLSKYGVCPSPEVTITKLGDEQYVVIVASDGVWEFMSSKDALDCVNKMRQEGVEDLSKGLVEEAVRRWDEYEDGVVDDTTAVVMIIDGDQLEKREDVFAKSRWRRKDVKKEEMVHGVPWLITRGGTVGAFDPKIEES